MALVVDWAQNGRRLKEWKIDQLRLGHITANNSKCWNELKYFRPGLTWTARTQNGFAVRVMPRGCIMGKKGPAILTQDDSHTVLLALLAIGNSSVFRSLVELQTTFGSYEVGTIQAVPLPELDTEEISELAQLGLSAWSQAVVREYWTETSHYFRLPKALLAKRRLSSVDASASDDGIAPNLQERIEAVARRVFHVTNADTFDVGKWAQTLGGESDVHGETDDESGSEVRAPRRMGLGRPFG